MAGRYTINVDQGSTWNLVVTFIDSNGVPVDLTGYTARMQVRATLEAATTVVSITSGSGITLGGAAGTITLTLAASATTALTAGTYVYDLEAVSGAVVTRVLEGDFVVRREVTR